MSWPVVELGSVVSFIGGSQPPKSTFKYELEDGYVRLLQIRDYKSDDNLTFIPKDSTKKFCSKDDVMIGRYGPPVFQILRGLEGAYNVALMKAQPSEKVDRDYLFYFLKQEKLFRLIDRLSQRTAGQSGVDMEALKAYPMILPPLDEQKRIAGILDKADTIRRKRQQAIGLADDFLRSVFLDMFGDPVTNPKGWEVKPLSELIAKGDKLNYGVVQPGDNVKDGVPLIRSGDLAEAGTDLNSIRKVSETIDEKHRKSRLKGNEILIACVGTIGKVGWVNESMIGWNIARAVTRIPLSNDVNREYVYRYLQSPVIQGYFQRETRAVAQPTLNVSLIGKTPIALPPKELQEEFLKTFSKVGSIKRKFSESGTCDSELFDSLSQQAFAGEL